MAVVRYWAAARAAAGRSEETVLAASLQQAIGRLAELHGSPFRALLTRSILLVDGQQLRAHDDVALDVDSVVEVLPPYAGGAR